MNSCEWSERVALLLDEEDPQTRAHAAGCEECTQLLAELKHDRELLRSMPIPEMELPRRRRAFPKWPWAAAAAAAAAVLLGVWFWPAPAAVEQLVWSIPAPTAPTVEVARARPVAPKRGPVPNLAEALEAVLPAEVNPIAQSDSDVVIAFQTEDPNVVIVLVGGDSND